MSMIHVKELERTHDPTNHLRAILFRFGCVKVAAKFESGWKLVIFDPANAFILRNSMSFSNHALALSTKVVKIMLS